jgi:hypothetical protein
MIYVVILNVIILSWTCSLVWSFAHANLPTSVSLMRPSLLRSKLQRRPVEIKDKRSSTGRTCRSAFCAAAWVRQEPCDAITGKLETIVDGFFRDVLSGYGLNIPLEQQQAMVEQLSGTNLAEAERIKLQTVEAGRIQQVGDEYGLPPPVFVKDESFCYPSFLGRSREDLSCDIDDMFLKTGKAAYKGTLKGRGTGKSTLCDMLRYICWQKGVLPIAVDFSDADTDLSWSEILPELFQSPGAGERILSFALSLSARIICDRFRFASVRAVQDRMHECRFTLRDLKLFSCASSLPQMLLERVLLLVRQKTPNERFDRVLVIVDESAIATAEWPLKDGKTVFSTLTAATVHNRNTPGKDGVTIFLSSLQIQAFEDPRNGTRSRMQPLYVDDMDPTEIRDIWLKLNFQDGCELVKDKVTRLLAVLAPLPRIISLLRPSIVSLSGTSASDPKTFDPSALAKVYSEAQKRFAMEYGNYHSALLSTIGLKELHALVFEEQIKLSRESLDLVAQSFFLNNLLIKGIGKVEDNDIIPESSVFILAQLDPSGPAIEDDVREVLDALRDCANNVIECLIHENSTDARFAGHPLEIIFPEWLAGRLTCALKYPYSFCEVQSGVNITKVR